MEKSTKKKILIGGSVFVILGVGGYFLWKYLKNKKEEAAKKQAELDANKAAVESANVPKSSGSSSASIESPFKSVDDVKKFQDWMDSKYPTWLKGGKLNKGSGYGTYGPSTQKAWKTYGSEYTTSTKAVVSTPKEKKVTASYFADPSKMINQRVYASSSETTLFDVEMNRTGKARKDEYLGAVTSVERTPSGGYTITLISPLKQVVKVFSNLVYFLVKE
jgi:cytoskeletal protein RodZ